MLAKGSNALDPIVTTACEALGGDTITGCTIVSSICDVLSAQQDAMIQVSSGEGPVETNEPSVVEGLEGLNVEQSTSDQI